MMRNRKMFEFGQRWAWVLVALAGVAGVGRLLTWAGRLLFGP